MTSLLENFMKERATSSIKENDKKRLSQETDNSIEVKETKSSKKVSKNETASTVET